MKNNTEYRNIWVWMETEHGYTQKVGFELLEKAKILAAEKNCEVVAVIIGNDTKQAVKDVAAYGADQMMHGREGFDHEQLWYFYRTGYGNATDIITH